MRPNHAVGFDPSWRHELSPIGKGPSDNAALSTVPHQACFSSAPTRADEIAASLPRPEVRMPGFSRGSAPIQYNTLAKMQRPVAANQTMAVPTKPMNRPHHGLCARNRIEPSVILNLSLI